MRCQLVVNIDVLFMANFKKTKQKKQIKIDNKIVIKLRRISWITTADWYVLFRLFLRQSKDVNIFSEPSWSLWVLVSATEFYP